MQNPDPVPTRVVRVTVHRNGALVVRAGEGPAGPVEVADLPLLHAADALRVRPARGAARDVRETCRLAGGGGDATAPDEAEVRRRWREVEDLDDRIAVLERRRALFAGLDAKPPQGAGRPLADPTALVALHTTVDARLEALDETLGGLRRARDDAAEAAARFAATRERDPAPPRFARGVRFELTEGGPFEIEYFVEAARWVPSYTLHLEGESARLRLDALVAQASGEDWGAAEVRVSTADLSRDTTLPEPTSWRIGTAQPARRPAFRPLPEDLHDLFGGYDAGPLAPPPPQPVMVVGGADGAYLEEDEAGDTAVHAAVPRDDEADLDAFFDDEMDAGPPPAPPPPPSAAPAQAMAFGGAPPAPKMRSAPQRGGGGGPGGVAVEAQTATVRPPGAPLTPRLRYAYLRLAGPEAVARGRLRPLDPRAHLAELVADHDPDAPAALFRAIAALNAAADRLIRAPLPPGTRPLTHDAYHQVFTAEGHHDVPGDGLYHRVGVYSAEAGATLEHRAVPRGGHDVFRYCTVDVTRGRSLPDGPLAVHVDGDFKVQSRVEGAAGGRPLELNLGVDPDVRVVDRKVTVQQQDKGLMSQTTRVDHHVAVRVRSSLAEPVDVVLYDRLPQPDDDVDDLTVTLVDSMPAAERTDRDPQGRTLDGGLRWTLTVSPGSTDVLAWHYRLELPAKSEVIGGNRRD